MRDMELDRNRLKLVDRLVRFSDKCTFVSNGGPPSAWRPEFRFWVGQALFWCVVLLMQAYYFIPAASFPILTIPPSSFRLNVFVRLVTGLPITLLLRATYTWLANSGWALQKTLFIAFGAIVVAAALELFLFRLAIVYVLPGNVVDDYFSVIRPSFMYMYRLETLTLWSLCFISYFQIDKVRMVEIRMAQAETALRTSELDRLEAQLQPHFLFNALTAVLSCSEDSHAVTRVTTSLSEYLRYCLSRPSTLAPLSEELDGLEHFLVVQQVRFGSNLNCQIHSTNEARLFIVPPMLVEPLLDNAMKYGGQTSSEQLRIDVNCHVENQELVVTVSNTGTWIEPGSTGRRGTGVENLTSRLHLLGLEGARLEYSHSAQEVLARLTVPQFSGLGKFGERKGASQPTTMFVTALPEPQSRAEMVR